MKQQLLAILAKQGQAPIIKSIDGSIRDLKRSQYTYLEIKETIRDIFWGIDGKIDKYIESIGY